jgi:hypothetical protein
MSDETRVLLCPNCGAPEREVHGGPSFPCSHCGAVIRVGPRRGAVRFGALADGVSPEEAERTRMVSLRAQAAHYDSRGLYAYIETPRDFRHLSAIDETSADFFPIALTSFKLSLERCAASPGRPELERNVYWLARKLKNSCVRRNETLRAKAVLETALDAVVDPGFRQLLLCALVDMARNEDDLDRAEALLADCDPRPQFLDLDTEYRTTLGMLLMRRERWAELLELVGPRSGEIPCEPSSIAVFHSLRIAALEESGRGFDADFEMDDLLCALWNVAPPSPAEVRRGFDGGQSLLDNMYADDQRRPHWAPARRVLERYRARRAPPRPPAPVAAGGPAASARVAPLRVHLRAGAAPPGSSARTAVTIVAVAAVLALLAVVALLILR